MNFPTFAGKGIKREPDGGLSYSTKSWHLPLRKQFRHEPSGKYISSLNEAAYFLTYASIAVIQYCTLVPSLPFCPTVNLTGPIPGHLYSMIKMRLKPFWFLVLGLTGLLSDSKKRSYSAMTECNSYRFLHSVPSFFGVSGAVSHENCTR